MKRNIFGIAAVAATIGVFTACGGSNTTSGPTGNEETTDGGKGIVTDGGGSNGGSDGSSSKPGTTVSQPGPGGPNDPIVGTWVFGVSGVDFVAFFTFNSDGTYEIDDIVEVATGTFADQEETGTYAVSNSVVTFTPGEWTCHQTDPVSTDTVSFQNGDLGLTNSSGVEYVFAPVAQSDAGGLPAVVVKGCYGVDGGPFVSGALAPVSN